MNVYKHDINERVSAWHAIMQEYRKGVVTDRHFDLVNVQPMYLVDFGNLDRQWCFADDIKPVEQNPAPTGMKRSAYLDRQLKRWYIESSLAFAAPAPKEHQNECNFWWRHFEGMAQSEPFNYTVEYMAVLTNEAETELKARVQK